MNSLLWQLPSWFHRIVYLLLKIRLIELTGGNEIEYLWIDDPGWEQIRREDNQ